MNFVEKELLFYGFLRNTLQAKHMIHENECCILKTNLHKLDLLGYTEFNMQFNIYYCL